ncbi:GxxExxY protein [Labilibaculum sp.]|uniref:GxxExxY protein n=1 Tax=Labilibaculum sp. TaxID=2060723 RepID=UPI0035661173
MESKVNNPEFNELIEISKYIYKQLGSGLKASVYSDVLELELELRNVSYSKEKVLLRKEEKDYLICFDKLMVVINSWDYLTEEGEEYFLNVLNDKNIQQALLLNFGPENLQFIKVGEPVLGC